MRRKQAFQFGKFNLFLLLTISSFLVFGDIALAQHPLTADGRLFNVLKSGIQRKGKTSLSANISYAFSGADYNYLPTGEVTSFSNFNQDLTLDYAFSRTTMISLGTTLVSYRTTLRADGSGYFSIPTSLRIAYKFGSVNFAQEHVQLGAIITGYIPVQTPVNQPFIPDQLSSLGIGAGFLTSYYFDPIFPENSPGFHFNFLFRAHLSKDELLSRVPSDTLYRTDTKTFARYGIGFEYPFKATPLVLFGEFWGEYAVLAPGKDDGYVYSREGFAFFGAGARYQFDDMISGEFLAEYLVFGNGSEQTVFTPNAASTNGFLNGIAPVSTENYAPFRFTIGVKFEFDKRFRLSEEIYKNLEDDESLAPEDKRRNKKILDVIDERSEDLAQVYRKLRAEDSTLAGRLYFDLVISKTGQVDRVRLVVSNLDESPLARKLEVIFAEQISNWRFPPGKDDIVLDVLKFEFTKRGGFFVMR
ncbi:MAG: hypothetical protein SFU91_10900 [Chloroherpetonaceae bacterium]|nr:hypothetical protein [Chloroherpetonaceae bacterium]